MGVLSIYTLSASSVCAGDMPISLEQWRAAVGRWVARIQRTLIIRRGVKRSPPCASNQEWESSLGQSHTGERKCMGRRKGRKKYKEDPVNDPADARDEFSDEVIVLAVPLMSCGTTVSKDGNPAGSLKELFTWTVLYAFSKWGVHAYGTNQLVINGDKWNCVGIIFFAG